MKELILKPVNAFLDTAPGKWLRDFIAPIPLMSWLIGGMVAALLELYIGYYIASALGMRGVPAIFGLSTMLSDPLLIPSSIVYIVIVYLVPTVLVARLTSPLVNRLIERVPSNLQLILHLIALYGVLHLWGYQDDYRLLVVKFIGIAIMLSTSLNLVNGYMGEFSCAHGGFMAVGAYVSSVIMVWAFVNDDVFGPPVLPPSLAPFAFPLVLIIGGLASALAALAVAIPSFRTRGDYLAIITLAFTFIVKSAIENLEVVGGPRGFMNQPKLASLAWVFVWTILCLWTISNYVNSTYGKATCAVRDNETAAEVMTVDTRRIKVIAFMTSAFWAGVAGGLFAHIMSYINPSTFGITKSVEALAMIYLGGLNSITGSIVGAVVFQLLIETLRPLRLMKWVIIPILLIILMIFRPRGILGFREIRLRFVRPKREVGYAPASD